MENPKIALRPTSSSLDRRAEGAPAKEEESESPSYSCPGLSQLSNSQQEGLESPPPPHLPVEQDNHESSEVIITRLWLESSSSEPNSDSVEVTRASVEIASSVDISRGELPQIPLTPIQALNGTSRTHVSSEYWTETAEPKVRPQSSAQYSPAARRSSSNSSGMSDMHTSNSWEPTYGGGAGRVEDYLYRENDISTDFNYHEYKQVKKETQGADRLEKQELKQEMARLGAATKELGMASNSLENSMEWERLEGSKRETVDYPQHCTPAGEDSKEAFTALEPKKGLPRLGGSKWETIEDPQHCVQPGGGTRAEEAGRYAIRSPDWEDSLENHL